jgi:protein-S-isoprenylcysteine O-methyltransferase Ste14
VLLLLKNLLFTLAVPGTVGVYLPIAIANRPTIVEAPWAAGVLLLAAGGAIYVWTVWDFSTSGRATPLPLDAPRKLVVSIFVALWFHLFVVFYEERRLRRDFGTEYDAYRASVPRWLPRGRRLT